MWFLLLIQLATNPQNPKQTMGYESIYGTYDGKLACKAALTKVHELYAPMIKAGELIPSCITQTVAIWSISASKYEQELKYEKAIESK